MKEYANGIWFNKPGEKAPDFILGNLSIVKNKFVDWLMLQEANEKGYVKLVIKEGKQNPYLELDTWKPTKQFMTERQGDNQGDSLNIENPLG